MRIVYFYLIKVDSDQIRQIESFEGRVIAGAIKVVNVESPANESLSFVLTLFPSSSDEKDDCVLWSLKLPVHMRYHAPQADSSHVNVVWDSPVICSPCAVNHEAQTSDKTCTESLGRGFCGVSIKPDNLTVSVPVGNLNHLNLVWAISLGSILLGTMLILVLP